MGEEKILVAGHLSLDRIKTPDREEDQVPGGAALYTSVAASVYGGTTGLLNHLLQRLSKGSIAAD